MFPYIVQVTAPIEQAGHPLLAAQVGDILNIEPTHYIPSAMTRLSAESLNDAQRAKLTHWRELGKPAPPPWGTPIPNGR